MLKQEKVWYRFTVAAMLVFVFLFSLGPLTANAAGSGFAVEVLLYTGNSAVNVTDFQTDLISALGQKGVDTSQVKYTNAVTTNFSATDTFAWNVYDHIGNWGEDPYPNGDQNPKGSEYNHHIIVKNNGKTITFYGNGKHSFKDFMFMPNSDTNSVKTFTFDLDEAGIKYHSMEGGGFLFNSEITNGLLSGYALLFDENGIELFELTKVNADNFHEATDAQMDDVPGIKSLKTFPKANTKNHTIKIVAGPDTLDMWDNGSQTIDGYELPTTYGSGFGPVASYNEHDCNELSYFTFGNLQMSMTLMLSLADVVNQAKWGTCSNHYVVNLEDGAVPDFGNQTTLKQILTKMSKDKAYYIGWGTSANKDEALNFVKQNSNKGTFIDNTDYKASVEAMAAYIADQLKADVAGAKDGLAAGFASGDSAQGISKNITLPEKGSNCTTVSWSSSDPTVISNSGVVKRPADHDVTVTLTATIVKGGISDTKTFTFVVKQREELVKTGSIFNTMNLSGVGLSFVVLGAFMLKRRKQVDA